MDLKLGKLENSFEVLERGYQDNGEIDWKLFNSDQKKFYKKIVVVKQSDFEHGTLRIKVPCCIRLGENILFNPNRPKTWIDKNGNVTEEFNHAKKIDPNRKLDWWPNLIEKPDLNKEYFEKEVRNAYVLGFFAAIALESKDIIIDLNNFIIQQHPEHALQQRFFSVIELADQPFVPKQGPANFGKIIKTSSNVLIKNGKIGLSSHHGIHGNSINTIIIKNIVFTDNEVCSIALNGCKEVYLSNIIIERNRHDIPVLGTFSSARFLSLFINKLQDAINNPHFEYLESKNKLLQEMDQTFNAVILKNGLVPKIFKNESGLIDGNYYGIIINPKGIAVFAPLENRNTPKANESVNIYFDTISIYNIKSKINEILAIRNSEKKILTGPSGDIFQFMEAYKLVGDKFYYKGNCLSDLMIEIVQLVKDNNNIKNYLGNFKVDEGMLIWKRNKNSYFKHHVDKLIGYGELEDIIYDVIGNGDSMFHVNKGTFGLKIDGINSSHFKNINISNIEAKGLRGSLLAGNYQKSHPKQDHLNGYQGHLLFGVGINASNDLTIENININNISSDDGSAYGYFVSGESNKITIKDSKVDKVIACQTPYDFSEEIWPNLPTNSRGLFVSQKCEVSIKNLKMLNITDTPNCLIPSKVEIYGDVNFE